MRAPTLVRRGLAFHARSHAATLAGVAVASAVLIGALAVGDSVRASLERASWLRTGRIDTVLGDGQRFFGAGLAARLRERIEGLETSAAIQLPAVVASPDGTRRVADVQLLGVEEGFFALAPAARSPDLRGGEAWLGAELARALRAAPGEELIVRTPRPSAMTRELALASAEGAVQPLRVTVAGVLEGEGFGAFALEAGAATAANLFVEREWLAAALGVDGRANRCFLRAGERAGEVERALEESWELADVGLAWRGVAGAEELTSEQVFLPEPVAAALAGLDPRPLGVLTYFVNALEHGERSTPYSMVAALGGLDMLPAADLGGWRSALPEDLGRDGIVLNDWTAGDLGAGVGDRVTLRYFVLGSGRALAEESRAFIVRGVLPTAGWGADPALAPEFPGIGAAENCRDWDPGLPLDLQRIRELDEEYWDLHRGAPKAFVELATGRELWANRYGSLTALRVASGQTGEAALRLRALDPGELGLGLRRVEARVQGTSDFGALFAGLSLFLIVSALLLAALFFAFSVERRASELGVLRVTGFLPREVARLLLGESLLLAVPGAALGALGGVGYARCLVRALESRWSGAVGHTELVFDVTPASLALGMALSVLLALASSALVLRAALRARPLALLWGAVSEPAPLPVRSRRRRTFLALSCAACLGCLAGAFAARGGAGGALAFGAGLAGLVAGLLAVRELFSGGRRARSTLALGWGNAARRPARSLATVALVASSVFLLVVAGASRQGPAPRAAGRDSGTGGFEYLGRTSLPVLHALDSAAGSEFYGFSAGELDGVELVPLRVRAGDEASCLNLDRPRNPRLLGVPPARLRGRFRFAAALRETEDPWSLLEEDLGPGVVPAVVDAVSLQWTLHARLGSELELLDGRGRPFRARVVAALADSILQGDLLVAERRFEQLYPAEAGYRALLVDVPPERAELLSARLARALADEGLALVPTHERLDLLHGVQNTYLAIFQALGGLGLALGSVGLLALVLRHAVERRGELALLEALGFTRGELRLLFLGEQGGLVWAGLVVGALAGVMVMLPRLDSTSLDVLRTTLALVLGVGVLGCGWVWVGTWPALRGSLLAALSRE